MQGVTLPSPRRLLWVLLGALVATQLALVWRVPVLPGQDLPQHLAYVRILADYDDPALPLRETFVLADRTESYFTTYRALAFLARRIGVDAASRVAYSLYVAGMVAAFAGLARAVGRGPRRTPWTAALAVLVVWNPVAWMGFLPFLLCMPLVLGAYAALVRASDPTAGRGSVAFAFAFAVALGAVLASVHVLAAFAFAALAGLHAAAIFSLGSPESRAVRARAGLAAAAVVGVVVGTTAVWAVGADSGARAHALAVRMAETLHLGRASAIAAPLHASWGTVADKLDYVVLALAGTLASPAKAAVGAGLAIVLAASARQWARSRVVPPRGMDRDASARPPVARAAAGRALLAFAVLGAALPAAVQQPSDVSFLDYRMIALACAAGLAWLDDGVFATATGRAALAVYALVAGAIFTRAVVLVGREGAEVRRLVGRLDARAVLLAVPLDGSSVHVDAGNSVGQYWGVFHTIDNGGVTSLVWGRFSPQLPVAWRSGRTLAAPDDRRPWELSAAHLRGPTHVLVDFPTVVDEGSVSARALLERDGELLACEGRHCLYRVRSQLSSPRVSLHL